MSSLFSVSSFYFVGNYLNLHSFPTRRSSDLPGRQGAHVATPAGRRVRGLAGLPGVHVPVLDLGQRERQAGQRDRKSTRLNSSHLVISYAVFCLKKKNAKNN